jgi:hypothetical protein
MWRSLNPSNVHVLGLSGYCRAPSATAACASAFKVSQHNSLPALQDVLQTRIWLGSFDHAINACNLQPQQIVDSFSRDTAQRRHFLSFGAPRSRSSFGIILPGMGRRQSAIREIHILFFLYLHHVALQQRLQPTLYPKSPPCSSIQPIILSSVLSLRTKVGGDPSSPPVPDKFHIARSAKI